MKKKIAILFMWLSVASAMAQNMRTVFINMPDTIEPLLTKVNREDCVDFLDSKMKAVVKNRFDRSAELKMLTQDYLQLQLTEVSTMEMKLLPLKDSVSVICMVKTVCGPVCDSEIRFYDMSWKELEASDYFTFPSEEVFFQPLDLSEKDNEVSDMCLIKASLSADSLSMALEYTTHHSMNKEEREKVEARLRKEPLIMQWEDGHFK